MHRRGIFFFLLLSLSMHLAGGAFFMLKSQRLFQPQTVKVSVIKAQSLPQSLSAAAKASRGETALKTEEKTKAPPAAKPPKAKAKAKGKTPAKPKKRRQAAPPQKAEHKRRASMAPIKPRSQKPPRSKPKAKSPAQAAKKSAPPPKQIDTEKKSAAERNEEAQSAYEEAADAARGVGPEEPQLSEMEKAQLRAYISHIQQKIQAAWNIPKHLAESRLHALVEVKILANGAVAEKKITLSSHNSSFDQMVLNALDKASPFLPPPQELKRLNPDGIFVFRLRSMDSESGGEP